MKKHGYVYILASDRNGTLYIGVTSNLLKRVWEHRNGIKSGFPTRYKVTLLVYYEEHERITDAIVREKQLKKWKRAWKLRLIESVNPHWLDLTEALV